MPTFPTLSVKPSLSEWSEEVANDPTISSDSEGGYRQTYPAFTRIVDRWNIGYRLLSQADKNTLRDFEKSVKIGSESFTWTNPDDNTQHTVRFIGKIKYTRHGTTLYWDANFAIEEV